MGGLVVKDYVMNIATSSIDKFIDIGTPHLGSPQAAKTLLFGDSMGYHFLVDILNIQKVKEISQNFPSVYQLLPSRDYFFGQLGEYAHYLEDISDYYDNNNITGYINNYEDSTAFLNAAGVNSSMIEVNDDLHSIIDDFDPTNYGIRAYNIVGCNQGTLGTLGITDDTYSEVDAEFINGDGTVPMRSAETLPNVEHLYFSTESTHAFLPSLDGNKQLIAAILSNSVEQFNLTEQYPYLFHYEPLFPSYTLCELNGYLVSYHSPIDLHIYDEYGNHVGPDNKGRIDMNIPGVSYEIIGTSKFAFLPKGKEYKVTGLATGLGHFNVRIKTIEHDKVVSEAYYNHLPLDSLKTNIEIEIAKDGPDYNIKLDKEEKAI